MEREKMAAREDILSPESIRLALGKFGLEISGSMAAQIKLYIDLLTTWNRKISLTSVSDPSLLVERHFGESLFGAVSAKIQSGSLLDIGSGAGFPALPIAMFRPQMIETLLEPNGKKTAFLAEVCRRLGLSGRVKIDRSRLEDFPGPEKYDFITSRAVAVTDRFLDRCAGLLEPNGRLVLWLGENEVRSAEKNGLWSWDPPAKIPGSDRRYVISGSPKAN